MDTYTASEDDEDTTWIQVRCQWGEQCALTLCVQWYCAMKGNEFFCECDEDYIQVTAARANACILQ